MRGVRDVSMTTTVTAPTPTAEAPDTRNPDLFTPYQLGPYSLANRMVMAPLTRNRAPTAGHRQ